MHCNNQHNDGAECCVLIRFIMQTVKVRYGALRVQIVLSRTLVICPCLASTRQALLPCLPTQANRLGYSRYGYSVSARVVKVDHRSDRDSRPCCTACQCLHGTNTKITPGSRLSRLGNWDGRLLIVRNTSIFGEAPCSVGMTLLSMMSI